MHDYIFCYINVYDDVQTGKYVYYRYNTPYARDRNQFVKSKRFKLVYRLNVCMDL